MIPQGYPLEVLWRPPGRSMPPQWALVVGWDTVPGLGTRPVVALSQEVEPIDPADCLDWRIHTPEVDVQVDARLMLDADQVDQ